VNPLEAIQYLNGSSKAMFLEQMIFDACGDIVQATSHQPSLQFKTQVNAALDGPFAFNKTVHQILHDLG